MVYTNCVSSHLSILRENGRLRRYCYKDSVCWKKFFAKIIYRAIIKGINNVGQRKWKFRCKTLNKKFQINYVVNFVFFLFLITYYISLYRRNIKSGISAKAKSLSLSCGLHAALKASAVQGEKYSAHGGKYQPR